MISYILLGIATAIGFLINLLPNGTGFPSEVHDAFLTLGSYFGVIDVFIPLSVLTLCLTTIFGAEIAIFGFKTIKWIVSYIPFIGGKGNQ